MIESKNNSNLEECPQCLGTGEVMDAKKTGKGFLYKSCKLCNGKKTVTKQLYDDYLFSMNEDYFETDE